MGSPVSYYSRMNDRLETLSDSDISDENDRDTDIATILQYLIRSGQVRIITTSSEHLHQDDSEDDLWSSHAPPKVDRHPDTSRLKDSDLSQKVRLNSGALNDQTGSTTHLHPLPHMLKSREVGMNGRLHFSHGDRCQINQRMVPNHMELVANYQVKVFCGTFARDGDIFLSAAQDYLIRLYDTQKGVFKFLRTVEARDVGWSILDTAVSQDGCNFVYCSWSECIHLCSVLGDHEIHEALPLYPDERRFCVFAMRFSQDGTEILGGANDECLYVYSREANKRILKIRSHLDDVNTVAFADNTSQILFSGGDDGICKVWDRRTLCECEPKPVGVLVGHESGITYVDPKGDGRHLITNSKDQSIKLWDMRAFSPPSSVEDANRAIFFNNWDYRWQRVPTSLNKHKFKLAGDTSLMTYRGHSVRQTLVRCHFSPEATTGQCYIYTGCAQGRILVYDVLTGEIKATNKGHRGCVRDVSWHPYRNEIISSSWDGTIGRWTYNTLEDTEESSDSLDFLRPRRSLRLAEQRRKQSEVDFCKE